MLRTLFLATVHACRVEQMVGPGGQGNYEEAGRIIGRMRIIGEHAAHAANLDELVRRYKAKRNFMKLPRAQIEEVLIAPRH